MAGSYWNADYWFGQGDVSVATVYVNVEAGLVDAVNDALVALGDQRIDSLDDDTDRARRAKQIALACLDARLQEHDWNFARRRAALVAEQAVPTFEFDHQFPLPTDPYCLQVRKTDLDSTAAYSIEENAAGQRVLLCNASTVSIVYTARVFNPALWSPLFREWYAARLAHELAYGTTAKAEHAENLLKKSEFIGKKAKARDGQEGRRSNEPFLSDVLTRYR